MIKLFWFFLFIFSFTNLAAQNDTISLVTYLKDKLDIISVEAKGGILNISGYKKDLTFTTKQVLLKPKQVLATSKWSFKPYLSLITIPFKIRNKIDTFSQTVQTGLTNAGVAINIYNYKLTRYFSSGKQSTHLFGLGLLVAPSSEDLTPQNTLNFVHKNSKQFFIASGVSIAYTYNDLTFVFIPVGFDFATTTDGKHYIYNKKRWWGFGIGISSKLFGLF